MGQLDGGITGVMTGKVAGIVGSKARGRRGTINTVRQYVRPANPNTPDQQTQRSKFGDALFIVRALGPSIYQSDFNRAVNQLPGFQSLMSVFLNNLDGAGLLTAPPDIPLGDLHFPDTFAFNTAGATEGISMDWSTELGANGTSGDGVFGVCIEAARPVGRNRDIVLASQFPETRASEVVGFNVNQDGVDYIGMGWMNGAGVADGLLSLTRFQVVTSFV